MSRRMIRAMWECRSRRKNEDQLQKASAEGSRGGNVPGGLRFLHHFDTVENRKARHQMDRKFVPGLEIRYEKEEDGK